MAVSVTRTLFAGGAGAMEIASADLKNDGNADLVITDDTRSVYVALGNGDGTFGPFSKIRLGNGHEAYPTYLHSVVRQVLRTGDTGPRPRGSRGLNRLPQHPIEQAREKLTLKGPRLEKEGEV